MVSPLHPRSAHTTSLFTSTLIVSFLVVCLPHVLPGCPSHKRGGLGAEGSALHPPLSTSTSTKPTPRSRLKGGDGLDGGYHGCSLSVDLPFSRSSSSASLSTSTSSSPVSSSSSHILSAARTAMPGLSGPDAEQEYQQLQRVLQDESGARNTKHSCPVPKPLSLLGRLVGIKPKRQGAGPPQSSLEAEEEPPFRRSLIVRVEENRRRRGRTRDGSDGAYHYE